MRALSLWNPWAALVAIEAKRYETRGWVPDQIGPGFELAIHAAAKKDRESLALAMSPPFRPALKPHYPKLDDLPFGAVLCVVRVVATYRTEEIRDSLSETERAFGDYSDGRYAWELELLERFDEPIPAKGAQKLWYWPHPMKTVTA